MILVNIPDNFLPERKYIIDILLNEFLGLEYQINITKDRNYQIILENGKRLTIKDCFFSRFENTSDYLNWIEVPLKVEFLKNQFVKEGDIPVIYGNEELKINENGIICGIDVFASSFFMLTRWEEFVNKARDSHTRFPAVESLAYRNKFLDRPVVNEYAEMLWNMLVHLGCSQKRSRRNPGVLITHDVDVPLEWLEFKNPVKTLTGDLLKRRNINLAISSLKSYVKSRIDFKNDNFNTFSYIFDISEKSNLNAHFFFMAAKRSKYDSGYSLENRFIGNLIEEISSRGHIIGFHPSYYTYNNRDLWRKEYEYLFKNVPYAPICGRQHFLRFEIPETWQIWQDNGMEWDSTLGYADREGFRCGSCYEFSVFNILTREKLRLKEKPLIATETNFSVYQNVSADIMEDKIKNLINKTKKYNGDFVLLWHNSSFNTDKWRPFQNVYEDIVMRNARRGS